MTKQKTKKYCDCETPCSDCKKANFCEICKLPIYDEKKHSYNTAF